MSHPPKRNILWNGSNVFRHQTLLISYHRINHMKNVTVDCINGNKVRGIPLRDPYLYTIKRNKSVKQFSAYKLIIRGNGIMKRFGFPDDILVVHDPNKNRVLLYDFDRRKTLELNYSAFLILDIINSEGNDKKIFEKIKAKDIKEKIIDIIENAKGISWLVEVNKPSTYHTKEIKTIPGLELIQWELTNKCNLSCIHCYNESCETNNTPELTTSEIKQIIDEADDIGVWQFDLTGGEIFMRDDIMEILQYLYSKHFAVRIATNGTLLDDDIIKQLERYKIRAYATSIDGGSPETNDFFRGADGAFEKTYQNLIKIKHSSIPIRRVNVTATTLNQHEMDIIHEMYTAQDIRYVVDNIVPSGRGEVAAQYNVSNEELIKYKIRAFLEKNEEEYSGVLMENIGKSCENITPSCGVYTNRIFVMASGEFTFCPTLSGREHKKLRLGDGRVISLKNAWENAQTFIKQEYTSCRNIRDCKYATICKGGCRSRAYITTGHFDSPDRVICEYMQYIEKRLLKSGR